MSQEAFDAVRAVSDTPPGKVHPVDEVLPTGRLVLLAIQHVLVMYTGAIAVPFIIGSALQLSQDQVAFLIQADLGVAVSSAKGRIIVPSGAAVKVVWVG